MQIIGNGKAWATISRLFGHILLFSMNFTLFGSPEQFKNPKNAILKKL
jgi:hypothetical protein